MHNNYIRMAFRIMKRNKLNTLINIIGLATGIACAVLSFLFIYNELSFDRFHKNYDTLFEVKMVLDLPMGRASTVPKASTGVKLLHDYPEVVCVVRMDKRNSLVQHEQRVFEEQALAVDPSFFDMFTFPLKYGEVRDALYHTDAVVLREAVSKKYYGDENPVGKTLSIRINEDFSDFIVTGVVREIPDSSSLKFDLLVNLEKVFGAELNDPQGNKSTTCFIQLQNKNQVETLLQKFRTTIDVPVKERFTEGSGHLLQSLAGFHLNAEYGSYVLSQRSTQDYSFILAAIAVLVLVIAVFNYINLSLGKSSTRIKEIGVRKVLGARRMLLIKQFCAESLLLCFFALLIGLVMVEFFLPGFNHLAQKTLSLNVFSQIWILVFFTMLVLGVGIITGLYPALFLSKFSSVDLFRGKMKLSRKNTFNRSLIIFQFAISIFLIVTTIFLYQQKNYMLKSDLGYDADQVLVVPLKGMIPDAQRSAAFVSTLKNKLIPYENIQGISASAFNLSDGWIGTYFEDNKGENNLVVYNYVDWDYVPTLGIGLTEGRNFSKNYPSDLEGSILINQSFARMLDVDSPVGRRFSEFFKTDFDRQIIGIVEDFHSQSLHDPIYPAFMGVAAKYYDYVYVKIKGEELSQAIAAVKNEFTALAPQIPFDYTFLDEKVARQYVREEHWTRMVEYSSLFALLIACSGLLGLTLQIVFQRTREIGIRRILGASFRNILVLINKEFVWLVIGANVLAWPAAYFAMSSVLGNYAFRVPLVLWVFVVSGLLAFFMAAVTISIHTFRVARINPSESLKYE